MSFRCACVSCTLHLRFIANASDLEVVSEADRTCSSSDVRYIRGYDTPTYKKGDQLYTRIPSSAGRRQQAKQDRTKHESVKTWWK